MEKVKKILAPTDLSALSCVGVRYALEMARETSAEVIVQYVVAMGEYWFSANEKFRPVRELLAKEKSVLDKFLREKFSDGINLVEIIQKVEVGTPYGNIVEMAERERVDMIIMSTHGRTGLDHILLGSVTEKVVCRAPCPVLVIPALDRRKEATKAA